VYCCCRQQSPQYSTMYETTVQGLRGKYTNLKYTAHSSVVIALGSETEIDLRPPRSAAGHVHSCKVRRAQGSGHLAAWQRLLTSSVLDELERRPIDKEVCMRMLSCYETRSQTGRPSGAPIKMNMAQPAAAAHRRKL